MKLLESNPYKKAVHTLIISLRHRNMYLSDSDVYTVLCIKDKHTEGHYEFDLPVYLSSGDYSGSNARVTIVQDKALYDIYKTNNKYPPTDIFA